MTTREPGSRRRPGRRRDPGLEQRVYASALHLYSERGWSGFSFEAVARDAGVGRSALYLRWAGPVELLVEALESAIVTVDELDRGSIRQDLLYLATSMQETFSGPAGLAPLRVFIEAHSAPELFSRFATRIAGSRALAVRRAIYRGVSRGELPAETDAELLADALGGAVIQHALLAPLDINSDDGKATAFAERLVDFLLRILDSNK